MPPALPVAVTPGACIAGRLRKSRQYSSGFAKDAARYICTSANVSIPPNRTLEDASVCRASQEPGGPRRCAGDTRARLAAIAARTMQLERIERDLLDDLEIDAGRIREQAGAVSGTIAQQLREHNNELFRIACLDVAGRNDSTTGQQASIGTSQRVWNTCGIARAARTGPKMSIWTNTVKCTGNSSPQI